MRQSGIAAAACLHSDATLFAPTGWGVMKPAMDGWASSVDASSHEFRRVNNPAEILLRFSPSLVLSFFVCLSSWGSGV